MNKVARDTRNLLPTWKLTGLIINETGIAKNGDKSVGVGWQYCGKTENGVESKYSFSNTTQTQYTKKAIACMLAKRFFY